MLGAPLVLPSTPSTVSARTAEQVRAAAEASGLLLLFQKLNHDTDAQSLERAAHWLKLQGARTVADLRELPPGTYTCKELADSLGLPLIMAQRLLTAIEGTKSSAIHHKAFHDALPRQVLRSCTRRRRSSPSRRRQ
jgi:hypothetical protein